MPAPRSVVARVLFSLSLGLVFVLAVPFPAHALGDYVGVETTLWRQGLDGSARIHDGTSAGTSFSFRNTLGVEEDDTARVGRVWFRLGKSRLFFDYSDTSRSGSAVLSQSLDFHGTTYTANQTVTTDLDFTLLQAQYRYTFDFKLVEFGVGLGFNVAQVNMDLNGSTTGPQTLDENIPYPTISAAFAVKPVPGFHIRAEANGMSVDVGGNSVDILDARLQIEYYIGHVFGLFGGYRTYRFNLDADDFGVIDSTSDGPYFGVGLKF
jgi:hypothetical protein